MSPQEAWVGDWKGTRVSLLLLLSCFNIVGDSFLTCSRVLGVTFFFVVTNHMALLASTHFLGVVAEAVVWEEVAFGSIDIGFA